MMENDGEHKRLPILRYSLMILYDIVAVNLSYLLALLIRCYVRFDFQLASEKYIQPRQPPFSP